MGKLRAFFKRTWPQWLYVLFYLTCLRFFLPLTFPYDKVKDRIVAEFNSQQRNSSRPQELQIDQLESYWRTGVKAKGVRLISPPTEVGKAPSVLSIDEARVWGSILGAFHTVNFDVDAFDGAIKGDVENSGTTRDIDVEFDGVDLARIDLIAASIGFPLDGKVYGPIKLNLPEGKASKGNGSIALEAKDLYAGSLKDKELTIKTPMGPFTLPRLKIGNLTITGEAKDGVLKISKISATGGDVDVAGDGKIQLRELATDAHLDINLKFKINDSYRNKNDKTKLLFGAPGAKEKPMIEMDPKMSRAKTADGFYVLRIGGTLGRPDVQPGSGAGGAAQPGAVNFK